MGTTPVNQFDFYLRFAKPLVLNLAEPNERVLAAAWLQKLRNPDSGDEQLRTDYLKLLLFVLQRKRLAGPFAQNPGQYEKLEQFPEQYKLQDVAKAVIEAEEEDRRKRAAQGKAGASGDFPPYTTEYSADLLEYTAAQDIPNFGVHAYYAISKDPLPCWDNADKGIFPRTFSTGKIDLISSPSAAASTSTISGRARSISKSRSRSRSRSRTSTLTRKSPRGRTPPAPPLGVPPPPDERVSPTWGTNLIQVSEPPEPLPKLLDDSFPDYDELPSGELSGDWFRGPSPQPYSPPFETASYQPTPRDVNVARRLDFDQDVTAMQYQQPVAMQLGEDAEDAERISKMLKEDQEQFTTPSGAVALTIPPPVPKKAVPKPVMTKRVVKPPGRPAMTLAPKVKAKPQLFPPKPGSKYQAPPPKKKVSKTTVKKTTTKGGKTTVQETVTVVEEPAPSTSKGLPQQKARTKSPKAIVPTPPAAAGVAEDSSEYDLDELRQLGLTEADLEDINLDILDQELEVEDISDREAEEYEEVSGVDLYDEEILKQLDEYDRRIKMFEEEFGISDEQISPYQEGPQIPFRTPSSGAPSLPYRTPPYPEGPQIPFRTPSSGAPSLPYQTPPYQEGPQIPFRTPSSGAPSLPYRTPPHSPGFVVDAYQDLYETAGPSFLETSTTEQPIYLPEHTSVRGLYPTSEFTRDVAEMQYTQAGPIQLPQEDAEFMQAWLQRFEKEEAESLRAAAMRQPAESKQKRPKTTAAQPKTPKRPQGGPSGPATPSKGAVKKVITKKESKLKSTKTVVGSTAAIEKPPTLETKILASGSKISLPSSKIPQAGSKLPVPGSSTQAPRTDVSAPPQSKLPVGASKVARPVGSKLPQPGATTTKTTTTRIRVVGPPVPLPNLADFSAASLPYLTPPVPGPFYKDSEVDAELEEFKALEAQFQAELSESQREFEQLEAESRRGEMVPVETRTFVQAVIDQTEQLYGRDVAPQARPTQRAGDIETDKELEEYKAMEAQVKASLSKSQRESEEREAELRRTQQRQLEESSREMTAMQSRASTQAVLDQVEDLYEGSRTPVEREKIPTPSSGPSRTPPQPKAQIEKTTTKKVTKTKGGVTTVTESKTVEKHGSKTGIPKKGVSSSAAAKSKTKPTSGIPSAPGSKKTKADAKLKKILPGSPAAQQIIDEANQQIDKLDRLYKKYQPEARRADVERTPPPFSRYGEIRRAGAGMVYPAEQFGLTEQEPFQSGTDYFRDRTDMSPYEDNRRPIAEVLPGLTTFPGISDWLLAEEPVEPPDQEGFETVITPTKPSPKQEMEEIMKTIEASPTWAGLPVTTPKRSPSPRRTGLAAVSPVHYRSPEIKQDTPESPFGLPAVEKIKPEPRSPLFKQRTPPALPRQTGKPATEQMYISTQEVFDVGEDEIITTIEETTVTTKEVGATIPIEPSTPPMATNINETEGFEGIHMDAYKSPSPLTSVPTPTKSSSPPLSTLRKHETLDKLKDELVPTSPEQQSPQFLDTRGTELLDQMQISTSPGQPSPKMRDTRGAEGLDQVQVDVYQSPLSPPPDNEIESEEVEEVTETQTIEQIDIGTVIEQHKVSSDYMITKGTPYMMIGKTRGKVYPLKQKFITKPRRSPIQEALEEDEDEVDEPAEYVTTEQTEVEVVEEIETDVFGASPRQMPSSYAAPPSPVGAIDADVEIGEELRPVSYYDSPRRLTPPPPKSPLPVMDPFMVDVAYAEKPKMRQMPATKMYPRVSPLAEDLEIEPDSEGIPIQTTPRRARTPSPPPQRTPSPGAHLRPRRPKRILKKRLIDFTQLESEGPQQMDAGVFVEGVPLPESPSAGYPQVTYPEDLMGVEFPNAFELYPRPPTPIHAQQIRYEVGLPEPMAPQARRQEPRTIKEWSSPKISVERLHVGVTNIQMSPETAEALPVVRPGQYTSIDTADAPQEMYSPGAQYGYRSPLATEGPGFVVEEIDIDIEEAPAFTVTAAARVATPPAPPTRWPTPPPEQPPEEDVQRVQEIQKLSQQQYDSLFSPSPRTPPKPKTIWDEQTGDVLEAEAPDELMPTGSPPSPFSTAAAMQEMLDIVKGKKYAEPRGRRPIARFGYGERDEKVVERKSKPPGLQPIPDDRIEPLDDYVYWPGPYEHVPFSPLRKVRSPQPLHPGHSRSPLYANLPPGSAKRRHVGAPSPSKGEILYKQLPPKEAQARPQTPSALVAESAIRETPVSRYPAGNRMRRRQVAAEVPSRSPTPQTQTQERDLEEEQDPLQNIMNVVQEQLAMLYTPPPPPIKTPKGERGKRLKQVKRRLFRDVQEPETEVAATSTEPLYQETVETVESHEVVEIPTDYPQPYQLTFSPQFSIMPNVGDELEYDVEPAEVYYRQDPEVSPARRPELRAPSPPPRVSPQTPPTSPNIESRASGARGVNIYGEQFAEAKSPVFSPPSPSEEVPSPFKSYTPRQSPPDIDPRLQKHLILHDYTVEFDRDNRPYQRRLVRVGSRSHYNMARRLPQQQLGTVQEEGESPLRWPEWKATKPPPPPGSRSPRPQQQQKPQISPPQTPPRPPPSPKRAKTPSPKAPTPPPPPREAVATQWKSPPQRTPVSPTLKTPPAERMQQFTPPDLYNVAEEERVTPSEEEFVVVEEEESVYSMIRDAQEPIAEEQFYYESPSMAEVPSPYLSYTPPLPTVRDYAPQQAATTYPEADLPETVQSRSPEWPQQFRVQIPDQRSTEQMGRSPRRPPHEMEQIVRRRKQLQFDIARPAAPIPKSPVERPVLGKWMTPPPSTSAAPPPILQRRPEYVTPPRQYQLAPSFTPPSQMMGHQPTVPMAPAVYHSGRAPTSPLEPPKTPWLPPPSVASVPSIQMEVVESVTTIIRPEYDYEVQEPFGGSRSPGIYDTSPMQLDLERSFIEDDLKGFKWMDQ